MNIEKLIITPSMAEGLLKKNTANRPCSMDRAKALSDAMIRGEWQFNGDTIRVADDGTLLDGQHRLNAVIISKIPLPAILITGLPRDSFKTIDGGKSRTTGDRLAVNGVKNYNTVAAAASLYIRWKGYGNPTIGSPDKKPTSTQIMDFIDNNPMIHGCAQKALSKWTKRYLSSSNSAFCLMAFMNDDPKSACGFWGELESGIISPGLTSTLLLRDRLMEDRLSRTRLTQAYKLALTFKAYRHYRDGVNTKTLRVRLDGPNPEKDIFKL
ncbi:hypothetical protein [Oceanimonas smirnovii]|uniref:hypothetical protein n=1 Tax=Oceanimonas smirnovii TaxID=264574 RepID=UPI00037D175F|nr:hypothetical protein [Oceanimonas smirnovii]